MKTKSKVKVKKKAVKKSRGGRTVKELFTKEAIARQAKRAIKAAGLKGKDLLDLKTEDLLKVKDNPAFKKQREMLAHNARIHHERESSRKREAIAEERTSPKARKAAAKAAEVPRKTMLKVENAEQVLVREAPIKAQPAPAPVGKGVYQNRHRDSALVHRVGDKRVHFLSMRHGEVRSESMSHDMFTDTFNLALPFYPLRRAARVYLNSLLAKEEDAARLLRAILAS